MTNTIAAEFYADQAQYVSNSKKAKNNVATVRTEELANIRPTPTAAECNSISQGNAVTLASCFISPNTVLRPAAAELFMQRKFPTRTP